MRSRWLVIGLVASAALNLFLIGAAAGVIALGLSMARQGALPRPGLLVRATQGLPQLERRALRMQIVDAWRQARPDLEQSRQARAQAWAEVAGPKPDAAAIKAELAQSRQIDTTIRARVEERFVDRALTLPAGDRAALAKGMREALAPPAAATPQPVARR